MNPSCLKRTCLNQIGSPASARGQTSLQWLPPFHRKRGLSSGSTRGVFPPTFAIASPSSSEGEAMAKAGGNGDDILIVWSTIEHDIFHTRSFS